MSDVREAVAKEISRSIITVIRDCIRRNIYVTDMLIEVAISIGRHLEAVHHRIDMMEAHAKPRMPRVGDRAVLSNGCIGQLVRVFDAGTSLECFEADTIEAHAERVNRNAAGNYAYCSSNHAWSTYVPAMFWRDDVEAWSSGHEFRR